MVRLQPVDTSLFAEATLMRHRDHAPSRSGVSQQVRIRPGPVILISLGIGLLATLVSGNVQVTYGMNQVSGNFEWVYGFPIPWRALNGVPCANPGGFIFPTCLQSEFTSYDWAAMAVDFTVNFLISFGLLLAIVRYHDRPHQTNHRASSDVNRIPPTLRATKDVELQRKS